jgi:phage nucleotide-binding protein
MKKLSEIKTEGKMKLLLYGDAGEGKTCFATSFPGPTLLLDFDGKADSAALFHRGKPVLDNIDVMELAANMVDDPIDAMNKLIDQQLVPAQKTGEMKYKTIILDSITTFSTACLAHIIKTNPGIKRVPCKQGVQPGMQDYGILKREFQKLVPGILSLDCNIIMTAHISVTKDDLTGQIVRGPIMDGSFSDMLPIYFKEVWKLGVDKEKRVAQTQTDFKYKCRSQIPGLPNPFDITAGYSALEKYL